MARGACAGSFTVRRTAALLLVTAVLELGCGAPSPDGAEAPAAQTVSEVPSAPAIDRVPVASPGVSLANGVKVAELLAAAKGKVLVVNVWATYCIPCIEEMPELARFYRERDAENVAFLSFSADAEYALDDTVKPFVVEQKLPFPAFVLQDLPPDKLVKALGAGTSGWDGELPATFVFDTSGALKRHWLELVHLNDLTQAVAEITKG